MGFETMGGMKVWALKGIEKQGNLWAVRYIRHRKVKASRRKSGDIVVTSSLSSHSSNPIL